MNTQYVEGRSSSVGPVAAFPSQRGTLALVSYRLGQISVMLRAYVLGWAGISYERQDGEIAPFVIEQKDWSKICLRRLKPFAHLDLWLRCPPVAATRPLMMNILWSTLRRSRLSQPTPANTNKILAGRAARRALPHMLHGGFTLTQEGQPC